MSSILDNAKDRATIEKMLRKHLAEIILDIGSIGDSAEYANGALSLIIAALADMNIRRKIVETNASGVASWTFEPAFSGPPAVQCAVEMPTGSPAAYLITQRTAGIVTVQVRQARPLPTLALVSGLLGAVISGINGLASSLSGFDVWGAPVGAGVKVHIWAAEA